MRKGFGHGELHQEQIFINQSTLALKGYIRTFVYKVL